MPDKFWEALGKKLAERWLTVSAPAVVFWLGGLAAWLVSRGGMSALSGPAAWLSRQPASAQIVTFAAVLLGVSGSGLLARYLGDQLLRLLQVGIPASVREPLTRRRRQRRVDDENAWQALAIRRDAGGLAPGELRRYLVLDRGRRRQPDEDERRLTRAGNILRAAELWVLGKYQMEPVAVWPRLWLLLPEHARQELIAARGAVVAATTAIIYGVAFLGFSVLTWWALPVGLATAALAYHVVLPARAQSLADLWEAAFDLYRFDLYRQLRWPLPASPQEEQSSGAQVTTFLWRGSDAPTPRYTDAGD